MFQVDAPFALGQQHLNGCVLKLPLCVAEQPLRGSIGEHNSTIAADDQDGVGTCIHQPLDQA